MCRNKSISRIFYCQTRFVARTPHIVHLVLFFQLLFSLHLFFIFFSGFCFLEYESHKAASLAKRRLETGRIKVWGCDIIVDWADPQEEPDDETMSQVNTFQLFDFFTHSGPENLKKSRQKTREIK